MIKEMLNCIRASLSDRASLDDEDDREDNNDSSQGKLSAYDEPGWKMGTITKTVQHCVECFHLTQMTVDKLSQPGWRNTDDYIH